MHALPWGTDVRPDRCAAVLMTEVDRRLQAIKQLCNFVGCVVDKSHAHTARKQTQAITDTVARKDAEDELTGSFRDVK